MYYVYFLRDTLQNQTYIGYTEDLKRRIKEHSVKSPELLYYEAYKDERDARRRERMLKQRGQGVRWLKHRLKYSLEN